MFRELLRKTARCLNKASIPYMVIGGQAVLLYGEPRLTKDIVITLGLGIDGLHKIREIIPAIPLRIIVDHDEEFVRRTMVLPTVEERSGIRVDFIFSFSPYERQAIERAKEVRIGRGSVRFASLEDVVIHKMIAGRARDIEDARSIIIKNPGYDFSYIEKWLREFGESLGENYLEQFSKTIEEIE